MRIYIGTALILLLLSGTRSLRAQETEPGKIDLAITYVSQRSLQANSRQNFWMDGGSLQLGASVWRGWGLAADVTGVHGSSIGGSGIPLSIVTTTFGPRYRWHTGRRISLYGQGLIGEANGFGSLFPTAAGGQSDANSFAAQVGGGVDLKVSRHLAARVIDAAWVRTNLPNSTNNAQNSLHLGAGLVLRFGR